MKQWTVITLLLSLTTLSCQTWRPVPPGDYRNTKHHFSAQVADGWMNLGRSPYFLISKDGVALNYIAVSRHQMEDQLEFTKKKFFSTMSPAEIAEVDLDDLSLRPQVGGFELLSQEPAIVDGHTGHRYSYFYTTKEGLKVQGIHVGFAVKQWVYRIQYEAAQQHYFAAHRDEFETFLQSFKVF